MPDFAATTLASDDALPLDASAQGSDIGTVLPGEDAEAGVVTNDTPDVQPPTAPVASTAWIERLLKQWREGPNLRALCSVLGTRYDEFRTAAVAVLDGFDLDTAVGEQLDMIGAVVDLPRLGDDDTRYRLALRVWALAMASHGWADEILTIVRTFIGAIPTLTLVPLPPMGYRLDVNVLAPTDLARLLVFVRAANPACYAFAVAVTTDTSGLLVDRSPSAVASAHNVDAIGVVVTDPGTVATIFT